jgi:hypothetical protein
MRKPAVVLAFLVLSTSFTSLSVATPMWLPGVSSGSGWSDVNKTSTSGSPDSLLCWAAAASNVLSWTQWWGWDGGSSSYLDTGSEIYAQFQGPLWGNSTGSPIYAYEWWMTDRTESIIRDPAHPTQTAKVFDSPGQDFYPGVNVQNGAGSVTGFWQGDAYTALQTYINDGRGTTLTISIPQGPGTLGPYLHSLTVWGWDPAAMSIYVTDSDDALSNGLVTYSLVQSGGALYIQGYTNLYTGATSALITEVQRLNQNDPFLEPVHGDTGGGVVPEPTTLLLLSAGLAGLLARRRSQS